MGDFFTRLAERTLGLAPVVQPDLMPVLLPMTDSEVVSDSLPRLVETGERATTPARKAAPYDDNDSLSRNMSITEIATVAGDMPQSLPQGWDQAVALAARADSAVDRQLEAPNREPGAVASPMPMTQAKQNAVEVHSNHLDREFNTGESTAPVETRQSPHASAVMVPSNPSAVGPTATPTVQISIGSIEIRAVTPAPTAVAQRSAERRGGARLSLEEYLRQRNEGRR